MLQSMALHPASHFLGTRIPEFALPSSSSLQLRRTRVWPRGELDTLEPSLVQEAQHLEPTNNGLLGQEGESPGSSNTRGHESEDYYQRQRTRRDVWVKPGGSLATDPSREAERKDLADKYTWVNPNRKHQTGVGSWPSRRAGIEFLNSTKDVPAALHE
jgi:hypothetical protein